MGDWETGRDRDRAHEGRSHLNRCWLTVGFVDPSCTMIFLPSTPCPLFVVFPFESIYRPIAFQTPAKINLLVISTTGDHSE